MGCGPRIPEPQDPGARGVGRVLGAGRAWDLRLAHQPALQVSLLSPQFLTATYFEM